ncbi:hypothetical protein DAT35_40280 [Vitiosangium sp. GDMCC 1.1324]|nr:hypothetical protein DAT35_40280 [Vitiosangium sp. GDMCC 1.1324]
MTDAPHGRADSLVSRGDRHLLVLGDGLQVGAVGPQGGQVTVEVESGPRAVQTVQEVILE